jgi:REP element-mobilizing transposase RayT
MSDDAIIRRRKLPHIDVDGKPYFISGCLDGSIPAAGLKRIYQFRKELDARPTPTDMPVAKWTTTKNKLVFKLVDELLDGDCPVTHFNDQRLAKIVANAFLNFADQRYKLFAFVVMPSHHHWLFLPDDAWSQELAISERGKPRPRTPREAISHSIQSFTANKCNRVLQQTGTFWQDETYDHYVRDEEELLRIIHYIEMNPVKAGLVDTPEAWTFSSASIRSKLGIPAGHAIPKMEL